MHIGQIGSVLVVLNGVHFKCLKPKQIGQDIRFRLVDWILLWHDVHKQSE